MPAKSDTPENDCLVYFGLSRTVLSVIARTRVSRRKLMGKNRNNKVTARNSIQYTTKLRQGTQENFKANHLLYITQI